jgi:hypothetical protein
MIEKRRLKTLKDAIPKYKYLLEAVSNCIRSFPNQGAESPFIISQTGVDCIVPFERDLFIPEAKFLMRVFDAARKNRTIVAVCKGYIHFCWNDTDGFKELLDIIVNGLVDYDYDAVKPVLILT